jgi:peptidoglycan/LPS O-acetylase OafA/YrhL
MPKTAALKAVSTSVDLPVQQRPASVYPKQPHILALDGLRGVAILLVLLHHFRFVFNSPFTLERRTLRLFDGGWSGVNIFFVLSGFLITGILLESKPYTGYLGNFYARRFLRIFPLYYAYLFLVLLIVRAWWMNRLHTDPWHSLNPMWYFLYVENWKTPHMFGDQFLGHLWSLAIEEQFYLVWPLVVLFVNRAALGVICVAGFFIGLISRLMLAGISVESSFLANTLTVSSFDALCAGALVALLKRNVTLSERARPWIVACAILSAAVFIFCFKSGGTLFLYSFPMQTWGVSALSILAACVVYWIACGRNSLLNHILSFSALRSIGRVSYGMYVLHPVVVAFVAPRIHFMQQGGSPLLQYFAKMAFIIILSVATYACATASWILVERPFLALKTRFNFQRAATA